MQSEEKKPVIKRPETLSQVRDALCSMYAQVMIDPRTALQVHEGANALGKAIGAAKVHLEYCAVSGTKPTKDWARFMADTTNDNAKP